MLETEIKKLTAAIEANTAALLGGEAPAKKPAKPKPAAKPAAAEEPVVEEPPAETEITIKEVTAKILDLGKAKGRQAAVSLLSDYGATKVPDLKKDPSKYGEIVAKIDGLLAA